MVAGVGSVAAMIDRNPPCPHATPGGEQFCIMCLRAICDRDAANIEHLGRLVIDVLEFLGREDSGEWSSATLVRHLRGKVDAMKWALERKGVRCHL